MASSIRSKSSHFSKNIIVWIFALTLFIILPLYISLYEIDQSRSSFSTVSLVRSIKISDGENVTRRFAAYGYNINEIKRGAADVPNLFLERLPRELTTLQDTNIKKDLFISTLLPPILKVNEYILYEREKLLQIIRSIELNGKTSTNDLFWLRRKMIRYRMNEEFNIDELYSRMNIIPPSLALTQAAIETGWGSSRFAQDANALYGQWTYSGDGMVPLGREEGKTHSIKKFTNLISAVESYALNLNTHEAYEDFRFERRKYQNPHNIDVNELLITLIFYSELGYEYIDSLSNIIRVNQLVSFDRAKLKGNSFQYFRLNPNP